MDTIYITFCFSNIKLVNNCFLHGNNCSLGGNNRQYLPFNITPYVNKCRAPYVSVYYPKNPWVNIFEISIFTFVKALYLLLRRLILETTNLIHQLLAGRDFATKDSEMKTPFDCAV